MSAVAVRVPRREPVEEVGHRRRLDVVSSREQKRSRPKAVYALVTVGGLFAILVAQLLLSIVVSDGAYQISTLQQQQRELGRDEQSLTEQLHVLESPQHLAANAEALGMVTNSSMAYLQLSDGKVLGKPLAATASSGIRHGKDGAPLIPNELLSGVALTPVSSVAGVDAGAGAATGAPGSQDGIGSVASNDAGLPSPNTR